MQLGDVAQLEIGVECDLVGVVFSVKGISANTDDRSKRYIYIYIYFNKTNSFSDILKTCQPQKERNASLDNGSSNTNSNQQ